LATVRKETGSSAAGFELPMGVLLAAACVVPLLADGPPNQLEIWAKAGRATANEIASHAPSPSLRIVDLRESLPIMHLLRLWPGILQ
jgi:hypothetical protein